MPLETLCGFSASVEDFLDYKSSFFDAPHCATWKYLLNLGLCVVNKSGCNDSNLFYECNKVLTNGARSNFHVQKNMSTSKYIIYTIHYLPV